MYHICYSNPEAWEISYKTGVYGNKEGEKGITPQKSNYVNNLWGIFTDLVALKSGDKIFFYVKKTQMLKGVFEVIGEPYFCQDTLFKDTQETYPFRFYFKEIKHYDNSIPVSELASLIEKGELNSITTFEKDSQAHFRGIRQITNDEGLLLEKTLYRLNPKSVQKNVASYSHNEINDELELTEIIDELQNGEEFSNPVRIKYTSLPVSKKSKNVFIAAYENALQGFIFYCLRRNVRNIIEDLDVNNFSECLMEFPRLKAQQFRSDILCIYRNEENAPHFYSFVEIKRDKKISVGDLSQLIGYMKTFSTSKNISFNSIEGIYISNRFDDETIQYLRHRKKVEKENPVRLIEYSVSEKGLLKFNQISI